MAPASVARQQTEEAFLDAAERLLVERRARRDHDPRGSPQEAGANHGLVHYYFGSMEDLLARVLERFTERLIERQREMYAAPDVPFVEKWRTAMRYLDDDRELPEGLVRAAGAGLEPPRAARAGRARERRVARRAAPRRSPSRASATGSTMPLDALVALVITFNQGSCSSGSSGIETGPRRAARAGSTAGWQQEDGAMTTTEAPPRPREQTRARYPDEEGYVERDGVRALLRGLRRRASRPCCCCRPGRSSTRGSGRRRSPTSPATSGSSPSTGAATAAPTGPTRLERVRRARVRRRRARRAGRDRHRARGARRAVGAARSGASCSPPSTRSGSPARSSSRRPRRSPQHRRDAPSRPFDEPLETDEGWAKYNRHYWLDATTATSSSSSSARCSPSRTRPSRSRTASAGGSRPTPETLALDLPRAAARTIADDVRARSAARVALPGARDPRRPTTRSAPHASGAALAELTGGALVDARRRRPLPARARPGARQPADPRLRRRRRAAAPRDLDARARPAASGRSTSRRRSGSATPSATSPSRASCAQLHPDLEIDWLAQHPVTAVLEAAGERIHPASRAARQRVRATSSPSRPSTTCTASRRCAGWTRSWSPTSWSSTTSSRDEHYDLWIGDEAWELDYFLHENPEREARRLRVADRLRRLAADARRRRARGVPDRRLQRRDDRAHRRASRACATGRSSSATPTTSSPDALRPGPAARSATGPSEHFDFAGYVTGFDPAELGDRERAARRARLPAGRAGLHRHRRRLGRRRVAAAPGDRRVPAGQAAVPGLRMIVVAGPRIDPASLPRPRRARGPRLRPRPLPPPRRLRPRRRAGRADHRDGADRQPPAVPLLPAAPPLRAELPRPPPARPLRRRPPDGLRDRDPRGDRPRDRRGDRARRRLPPGRDGRRRRAAARLAELL